MWVVVDATNTARNLYPDPSGYAGPDGLDYRHIHDGALRRQVSGGAAQTFPHNEGDTVVIGPECFAKPDGSVLCWRGENYVPQPAPEDSALGILSEKGEDDGGDRWVRS